MNLPKTPFEILMESVTPRIDDITRVRAGLSFFNANVRERRRRMEWMMRFADEYRRVEAIDIFGTRLMLADLEKVIEGDFLELKKDIRFWDYSTESENLRARYEPLHAPWKKLLEEYVAETEATLAGLGEA